MDPVIESTYKDIWMATAKVTGKIKCICILLIWPVKIFTWIAVLRVIHSYKITFGRIFHSIKFIHLKIILAQIIILYNYLHHYSFKNIFVACAFFILSSSFHGGLRTRVYSSWYRSACSFCVCFGVSFLLIFVYFVFLLFYVNII